MLHIHTNDVDWGTANEKWRTLPPCRSFQSLLDALVKFVLFTSTSGRRRRQQQQQTYASDQGSQAENCFATARVYLQPVPPQPAPHTHVPFGRSYHPPPTYLRQTRSKLIRRSTSTSECNHCAQGLAMNDSKRLTNASELIDCDQALLRSP